MLLGNTVLISTCTPMTFSSTSRFIRVTKGKRSMSSSIVWMRSIPWLRQNRLLLNGNNTKMITFGTKQRLTVATNIHVTVDGCLVSPDATTNNLGIVYDSTMSMEHQVNAVCRGAYLRLHKGSSIIVIIFPSIHSVRWGRGSRATVRFFKCRLQWWK